MISPIPPFGFFELCAACGLARRIGGSGGVPPSPPFPVTFRNIFTEAPYLEITCPRCGYKWREATVSDVETL